MHSDCRPLAWDWGGVSCDNRHLRFRLYQIKQETILVTVWWVVLAPNGQWRFPKIFFLSIEQRTIWVPCVMYWKLRSAWRAEWAIMAHRSPAWGIEAAGVSLLAYSHPSTCEFSSTTSWFATFWKFRLSSATAFSFELDCHGQNKLDQHKNCQNPTTYFPKSASISPPSPYI